MSDIPEGATHKSGFRQRFYFKNKGSGVVYVQQSGRTATLICQAFTATKIFI